MTVYSHKARLLLTIIYERSAVIRLRPIFRKRIFKRWDALIDDELSWQHNQIKAYSFLVYKDDSVFWRNKRSFSIEQKHAHQYAIGELLGSLGLLLKVLRVYLESKFEQGDTDLGAAFIAFKFYLANEESYPQLVLAVKKLLNTSSFHDSQTAGIVWLSDLYCIEKRALKNFVQLNFELLIFKQRIPASHVASVIY